MYEDEEVWMRWEVLARMTSALDSRNGKHRKYNKAAILLCDAENTGP